MSQPHVIRSVLQAVRRVPGFQAMRVMDLSCGDGEILQALRQDGCTVEGTHYRENDYVLRAPQPVLKEARIHTGVALNQPLPLESDAYDIVIVTEVLEHLPDHLLPLSEISRILKPGGHVFITTPNISRLHSRLQFFITGNHKLIRRRVGWDLPLERFYEYHFNPVYFPVLHAMLQAQGMSIVDCGYTLVKFKHLYLLLLWPLILAASLASRTCRKEPAIYQQGEADLFRKLTSLPLLLSEQLLVVARKRSNPA